MIEEDLKYLEKEVDSLKKMISYICETKFDQVKFKHLDWCRNMDRDFDSCNCGAKNLNGMLGRY